MIGGVPLLVLRLPAWPRAVGEVRASVCAFAAENGVTGALLDDIALAVTEAAANVVRHAYPEGVEGPLSVLADFEEGALEVVVRDEGAGFQVKPSAGLGAGLRLIAACTATFGIGYGEDGAEVWMRFLPNAA